MLKFAILSSSTASSNVWGVNTAVVEPARRLFSLASPFSISVFGLLWFSFTTSIGTLTTTSLSSEGDKFGLGSGHGVSLSCLGSECLGVGLGIGYRGSSRSHYFA